MTNRNGFSIYSVDTAPTAAMRIQVLQQLTIRLDCNVDYRVSAYSHHMDVRSTNMRE